VEVDAAHLGLAFNPTVWNHVRRALLDNAARIAQPFADGSDNYQRNWSIAISAAARPRSTRKTCRSHYRVIADACRWPTPALPATQASMSCPVTRSASSLARDAATVATSPACPARRLR
jgi:hypothetical protein